MPALDNIGRRRTERVRTGPMPIMTADGARGTVVDLSELGALIDLGTARSVGAPLSFHLYWSGAAVTVHGKVVRSTAVYDADRVVWADPDSYHVAVEFRDVAAEAATTLQKVKQTAKRAAPLRT